MRSKASYKELEQRVEALEKELDSYKIDKDSDRINQQHLEAILNNTNIPIYLKNADYKYIFMNRQLGCLAHVAHDQVQGMDDFTIFPEPTAKLFRSQDEEVVARRALIEFEETILLPDGIQTFITAKFPLFDNEGKVSAVGGVCTDITDRKKTEGELKEAEEKYRGIFEHSPLGIIHIDKEGIITASNEKLAEIFGFSIENIVGFDLLQSLQDEQARAAIVSVLSGKLTHCEGYYKSVTGGGTPYIRCVFAPISSNDGAIVAAIGIIEDVTRKKGAEKALQKAHDELEQRVVDRTAQLDRKTERLVETNVALKVLLEKRDEDIKEHEEKVMFNVERLINPYLEKLRMRCNQASQEALLKIIQLNLDEITSSFQHNHKSILSNLTPTQIQIADLIKQGHTTKEIASLLNLSPSTIACHRQDIRKRLSLTNKKTNLQAALTTHS